MRLALPIVSPVDTRLLAVGLRVMAAALALSAIACDEATDTRVTSFGPPDGGSPTGGTGGTGGIGGVGPGGQGGDPGPAVNGDLSIVFPTEGAWVNTRRVVVQGSWAGPPTTITVNGVTAIPRDTSFTASVELEPGDQTLHCVAGDTVLDVHVKVDPVPPAITIANPPRASWVLGSGVPMSFTVTDDNGLTAIYLSDRRLQGGGPNFNLEAPLTPGLNLLQVRAEDLAGNLAYETSAVIAGPARDPELIVNGAFRLHIGATGLAGVGAEAARIFDETDLRAMLPAEPVEMAGIPVELAGVRHAGTTTVQLTPDVAVLAARFRVEQVVVDLLVTLDDMPYPVAISAAAIEVTANLAPEVIEGHIRTNPSDLALTLEGFSADLGDAPPFGEGEDDGEVSLLQSLIVNAATDFANEALPTLLDDALAGFDAAFDVDLMGVLLHVTIVPEDISVQPGGLGVRAGGGVTLLTPPAADKVGPGFFGARSDWDGVPETDNLAVAVDDDFVNLLLYQLWRSGGVLPVIDQAWLVAHPSTRDMVAGFVSGLIATSRRDIQADTPFRIETALNLPPVVSIVAADTGAGMALGIGALGVHIATDDAARQPLLDGLASLAAHGVVHIAPGLDGKPALVVDLGEVETAFDLTTEDLRGEAETSIEGPVAGLMQSLGDALPSLMGAIPLPALDNLPVHGLSVGLEPEEPGFLRVDGVVGRE